MFSVTDVIGVCKSVDEMTRLTTKSNKEVSKRTISLMDTSGKLVTVTLWGEEVSKMFDGVEMLCLELLKSVGKINTSLIMRRHACCNGYAFFSAHLSFQM